MLEVLTADSIGRWSIRDEATSIRITVIVVFVGDVCQLLLAIFQSIVDHWCRA